MKTNWQMNRVVPATTLENTFLIMNFHEKIKTTYWLMKEKAKKTKFPTSTSAYRSQIHLQFQIGLKFEIIKGTKYLIGLFVMNKFRIKFNNCPPIVAHLHSSGEEGIQHDRIQLTTICAQTESVRNCVTDSTHFKVDFNSFICIP